MSMRWARSRGRSRWPRAPADGGAARPLQPLGRDRRVPVLGDPAGRLSDLFVAIDALAEQAPDWVVALAAEHRVEFLPPLGA